MQHSYRRLALAIVAVLGGGVTSAFGFEQPAAAQLAEPLKTVCPPFFLRDESGAVIDPVAGINDRAPYSPRQTCGATGCHDYAKITQGYHFTQGAGEPPTPDQRARIGWASSPGNFGGNWCSPGPLYRYLSPVRNATASSIDMTAFTFVTGTCGTCHPGGGPAEFDRAGRRYDQWMADPASALTPGGDNGLNGDYYKARWSDTGVLEADCLLCHLPGNDYKERQRQIERWNLRWAATAGSGLAKITGSIKDGQPVEVMYDVSRFNSDGTLEPPMVRSPRNEACLSCHAQPGWKKRGANFRARTDVHLRAGLRCVDCHPAGSSAQDPRIAGHEVHQIAKGDDPGGLVRNDLDDTVVACMDCHGTGRLGAPRAVHRGLPPLHLERIACQTCHIPERVVMPIQLQASDVFNPEPRIFSPGKKLWTFYGPDGRFRNHYGYLEMMGYDDKPTERFRPELVLYKGKIWPVNRVHTSWPGIEVDGQTALLQPRMSDVYAMWTAHRADPARYPQLAAITDDTGDGVLEINRAEEIDALIASVTQMLVDTGYPMDGKRVVWVMNDRVYRSGSEFRTIDKHAWEASPFGNVHKYSHDIYSASAALGARGCSECHSAGADFFFAPVLRYPFDEGGRAVTMPQFALLGYAGAPRRYDGVAGRTAAFFRGLTIAVLSAMALHIALDWLARMRERRRRGPASPDGPRRMVQRFDPPWLLQHALLMISVLLLIGSGVFLWALRYPGAHWAAVLSGALGGVELWRVVHRIGGGLLIATSLVHLGYIVFVPAGRRDVAQLVPRLRDVREFIQNLAWMLGLRRERPRFGRFTYFEKFDYWAVFWGVPIMTATGLAMWFPEALARLWPSIGPEHWDAIKEAHAHEALLAACAIAVWHMYHVHLRPGRFPGSLAVVHGRLDADEWAREHPDEPMPPAHDPAQGSVRQSGSRPTSVAGPSAADPWPQE